MDMKKLCEMVREAFPEGHITLDALYDWLEKNAQEVLINGYDSVAELLENVSVDAYDRIVYDLVTDPEFFVGLAYELACMGVLEDTSQESDEDDDWHFALCEIMDRVKKLLKTTKYEEELQ